MGADHNVDSALHIVRNGAPTAMERATLSSLPLIRSSERVDFKRCPKKWFWRWRMGLVPKAQTYGALELGTWMHGALAAWYSLDARGLPGSISLPELFTHVADTAIRDSEAPDYQIEQAQELRMLGLAMTEAYERRYGRDDGVHVIQAEVPLEFEFSDEEGRPLAIHKLKPDLVYADDHDDVWLMETKTAKQIRLEHLVIDDQARPYVSMAELALRKLGLIRRNQKFRGVMYNFLRKALPDLRPVNEKGQALNKNGSVSKQQPTPVFVRHPITLSRQGKQLALRRLQTEAIMLTRMTSALREKQLRPEMLPKTPHSSCAKLCPYFAMCVVEEQGGNFQEMQRSMYVRRDPYVYEEETTDIPTSFELS